MKLVTKFLFLWLENMVHSYKQSLKSLSAIRIKCKIRNADERFNISQIYAINVYDYINYLNLK